MCVSLCRAAFPFSLLFRVCCHLALHALAFLVALWPLHFESRVFRVFGLPFGLLLGLQPQMSL